MKTNNRNFDSYNLSLFAAAAVLTIPMLAGEVGLWLRNFWLLPVHSYFDIKTDFGTMSMGIVVAFLIFCIQLLFLATIFINLYLKIKQKYQSSFEGSELFDEMLKAERKIAGEMEYLNYVKLKSVDYFSLFKLCSHIEKFILIICLLLLMLVFFTMTFIGIVLLLQLGIF